MSFFSTSYISGVTYDFIMAMKLLNKGILDVKSFVSDVYSLDNIVKGIRKLFHLKYIELLLETKKFLGIVFP